MPLRRKIFNSFVLLMFLSENFPFSVVTKERHPDLLSGLSVTEGAGKEVEWEGSQEAGILDLPSRQILPAPCSSMCQAMSWPLLFSLVTNIFTQTISQPSVNWANTTTPHSQGSLQLGVPGQRIIEMPFQRHTQNKLGLRRASPSEVNSPKQH